MLFVFLLQADARVVLSRPILESPYQTGTPKLMLSAEKMPSLYDFFTDIPDPRRAQGRRHSLPTVLAISAAAVLCGREGYKAIWDWAKALGPKGRERFRCRYVKGSFLIPSESIFRDVLILVDPEQLDRPPVPNNSDRYYRGRREYFDSHHDDFRPGRGALPSLHPK